MATLQVTIWYHPLSWWIYEYGPVTWWTSYTVESVLSQTSLSLDNCYSTSKGWDQIDLDAIWSDIFDWNDEVDLYQISCPVPLFSHGHIDTLHMRHIQETITDYSAMRGPCPEGFHIPSRSEWEWIASIMTTLNINTWPNWKDKLKMPYAGECDSEGETLGLIWGEYWACNVWLASSGPEVSTLGIWSGYVRTNAWSWRTSWRSVRWLKDSYTEPDSTRVVIEWTLWSAWIFRDQTNWLISITDWTKKYTMMDKNMWATTVDGKWSRYQWGNNYWFPNVSMQSNTTSTKVDASSYWPWNYYYSDKYYIGWDNDRSSTRNDNLRWYVTWPQTTTIDRREPVYYGPEITLLSYEEIIAMAGTDKADDIVAILNEHPEEYYNKLSSEWHMELDSYHTWGKNGYVILYTNDYIMYFWTMTSLWYSCSNTHIWYIPSTWLRDYFCDNEPT